MKIVYFCPDSAEPSGGTKNIYKHVELLVKNHFDAYVLHQRRTGPNGWTGKLEWFRNDVPILYAEESFPKLYRDDYFIVPELLGTQIVRDFRGLQCNKIVYVQSFAYIASSLGYRYLTDPNVSWKDGGFKKVFVISDVTRTATLFLFDYVEEDLIYIPNFVDSDIFHNHTKLARGTRTITCNDKEKTVVFNVRKYPERCRDILLLVKQMIPSLHRQWSVVEVSGMSQAHFAELLRKSAIYLSCSPAEGFGIPLLEAMACNAIAVGHSGLGALDFFDTEFADHSNTTFNTAVKLSAAIRIYENGDRDKWNVITKQQLRQVDRFSIENTERHLISFFSEKH